MARARWEHGRFVAAARVLGKEFPIRAQRSPMQQTMVLEEALDRRAQVNHQPQDTGGQAAAPAGTSELVARASAGDQGAWDQLVDR
jgi:hypothetical protein